MLLTEHTPTAWDYLKSEMQEDNRASFDDIVEDLGYDAVAGSLEYRENAYLSVDDGGSIVTIDLTEV